MTIFLVGASGFVGERVLADLIAAGHTVTAQVHSARSQAIFRQRFPEVPSVRSDLSDRSQTKGLLPENCEAIIYLPGLLRELGGQTFEGIHVEGVRNLLAEAHRVGARRWIQMSALGARPEAKAQYYRTKFEGENLVRASGLDWTILRPSLIFDDRPRRQHNFVGEVAKAIRMAPFLPILGNGKFLLQPVSVEDVSRTIVQALSKAEAIGETYEIGGPEKLTYKEVVRIIARAIGTRADQSCARKPAVSIPIPLIELAARLLDRFPWFPISLEEIEMLKEGNYVHSKENEKKWRKTFDVPLTRFDESAVRAMLSKTQSH